MWFDLEVYGAHDTAINLERFALRAVQARPALEMIALRVHGEAEMQFGTEGAHMGDPWAPLSDWRLREKRAAGYPDDILVATGDLRKSLTRENAKGSVHQVTDSMMRIGTEIPYAWRHQKGVSEDPRYKLPKREMLKITPEFRREIIKRLQRFVVTGEVVDGREAVYA